MIASITRPSNPNPWLEYLKRVLGSMAGGSASSAISSFGVEVGPAVDELAGIGAVAGKAGAVRQKLRDGGFGDLRMQALHILPDRIVQPQLTLLPQLHDSGRGETLGMRSDPEAVARGELFAGGEIGVAEREFRDDLAAIRDRDDAAGPLRGPHLEFDPVADVADRGLQPWFHGRDLQECQMTAAVEECRTSRRECCRMLPDKTKPAQPFKVAPAD